MAFLSEPVARSASPPRVVSREASPRARQSGALSPGWGPSSFRMVWPVQTQASPLGSRWARSLSPAEPGICFNAGENFNSHRGRSPQSRRSPKNLTIPSIMKAAATSPQNFQPSGGPHAANGPCAYSAPCSPCGPTMGAMGARSPSSQELSPAEPLTGGSPTRSQVQSAYGSPFANAAFPANAGSGLADANATLNAPNFSQHLGANQNSGQMPGMLGSQMNQMPSHHQMPSHNQMPSQMNQMPSQMNQMPSQMNQMAGMNGMPGQMTDMNGMPGQGQMNGFSMPGQMLGPSQSMDGQMPGQMYGMPGQMNQMNQMPQGGPLNGFSMPGQMPGMQMQSPDGQIMPGPGQLPGQMPQMPGQMPGQMPMGITLPAGMGPNVPRLLLPSMSGSPSVTSGSGRERAAIQPGRMWHPEAPAKPQIRCRSPEAFMPSSNSLSAPGKSGREGAAAQEPLALPLGASAAGLSSRGSHMDGVLEQCMDTKEQVSNLAAVLKLLEGDMDIIRRENLQLRAAMRERLYPSGHGAGNRSGSEEGAQDGPNRRDGRPGMQQIPGEKLSPRTANRGQESLRGPMRAKNRPEEDRRGKRRDSDLRIPGVPEHEEVGCPMPAFARQLGPGSSAASLSGQSGQDWRSPASHPTALSKQWDPFREINDRQDEGDTGNEGKGHPDEDGSTGRGPGDMRGERDPRAGNVPRQDDAAAIQPDPSGRARGISAQSRAAIGEADARAERERLEKEKHEAAFQRAAAQARQAAQDAQEAQQAVQLQEKLAAQREAELQELEKQLIEQRRKNEQLSREAELAKEQNAPAKQAEDRSNRRPEQRLPGSDGRSDSKASAGSRAKSQPDPSEDRRRHSSELRGKSSIPASGHEVDRPPMPAFARQLPASSGESGQEEDGRTRRPGAYSRLGEDGPGARRDWEANADWDAFMELGDSAHVHARGGMSAQSRAAIGEADARAALERLEKEKHEAAFLRAAAQARTAAQEAQEAHQAAQHQERLAAQREVELQDLEKQLAAQRRKNDLLAREAELAKSREEQRNVKQAMEVEDLAQQLEDAKRRNQELQEAAQAAAAAEQKVRQEARQARSEAEAAALNARESEQIAAQHAQEVVNQAASLAELRARLGVQQHMAQVQENAAQRALAIAGPNASHAVAWPGPPLEDEDGQSRPSVHRGGDGNKSFSKSSRTVSQESDQLKPTKSVSVKDAMDGRTVVGRLNLPQRTDSEAGVRLSPRFPGQDDDAAPSGRTYSGNLGVPAANRRGARAPTFSDAADPAFGAWPSNGRGEDEKHGSTGFAGPMHSMPEDEGCNWPSAADSRPAWAEMSAMPQYPMPKGQEMTKGKEHWRKLRAKYGTAAAFEQLLQQVRADNTQALYEDDWAKRGVSRIPTEMSRAPTNMTRHNSVGGGNTEARAEARKVPSPDPEEMFQPLSEDENDSVGTGEDHQYGKNWQKVRRALGAAAAFNGLLQDVRENQANSLYERDWNRPQFGGSAKLMGHRMPTQFLGPGLRTVTGDSMLGQRSAKLGVRAKSQKIAAVANAGEDVSMSRAKSQKVASFASFGDAEGPLVPGASAARNSGGAQKAFGEEREAREREGGGSRNYAQKATAIFGAGDFDALSPGSGSPTSSVASPKAKDPKSAISRQPSRKNASKVMVRTVSEEDQAIAEAAARKAAADAANEAPNREDKATPRSIAEHTARAAGASSRGAPATQSGRSQPSERSEQLGRGEAAKGDALRFDRANVAPSSGRGSERAERSGEKGDALRFDRATQRRGESKGDSKFERVPSNQSQQSPQTPHRTVAERAAAERLRANGGSGDSSKFDRAHSQQSQQSPQTPHRTVAERAAEERLRANGGSGDSSKFDRAQSQQSQPSPQTPHRTVAERAAEASRLNAASGELRGEGYKFGGPAQPRAAERVAGSGDLRGEGYKFGGSGASGSRGGSGSGTAAANAEGKGKGKEAKPQAQRFSMGSDSDAEEMQPYASVPSDGASFSRKPSVALTVKEGEMDMTREKSIVIAKAAKTPSLSAANARKVKEASELPEAEEGQLVEAPAEDGQLVGKDGKPLVRTKVVTKHTHSHTTTHSHSHTHSHTHTTSRVKSPKKIGPGGESLRLADIADDVEIEETYEEDGTQDFSGPRSAMSSRKSVRTNDRSPRMASQTLKQPASASGKLEESMGSKAMEQSNTKRMVQAFEAHLGKEKGHKRAAMPWGGVGVGIPYTHTVTSER